MKFLNIKFLKKNKFNAKKNKLNTKKFKEKNKLQINLYPEKLDIMEKNIIKIEVIAPKR
jgi:stress response protein YsnF